ncbi:flagellar motor protein MotB [Nitrospirillum viridazoti]|uniref:MotA/MotB-like proton-channel complex protein n=1 Tax=Nitrospirillum amazonense TaxID=28077 RepID=A0A560IX86_9PROT|nr:flagellar motor protein MotB [Nitrospirillum amazonense]TWB63526.1 MotA/MotB-like proton-channel complex protein [Nitrospirillum amazonense]
MAGLVSGGRKIAQEEGGVFVLYLSVFFLLLAFFILLTSLSTFENRKFDAVVQAVQDAFGVTLTQGPAAQAALARANERLGAVGRRLVAVMPDAVIDQGGKGGTLAATMPTSSLFATAAAEGGGTIVTVLPGREGVWHQMAEAVRPDEETGLEIDLEFLVGDGGNPGASLPVFQAGAMARTLAAAGVAPRAMTVGVEKGRADTVRFLFRARLPHAGLPAVPVTPAAPAGAEVRP